MDDFNDIKIEGDGNLDDQPQQSYKPPSMFQMNFLKMTKDMRFVGMFYIIVGAMNCLSIVGAIVGVPYIFIGIRMREAADQFDMFRTTNNPQSLRSGFELQGKFFSITKILIIISLAVLVFSILLFIMFFGYAVSSFDQYG